MTAALESAGTVVDDAGGPVCVGAIIDRNYKVLRVLGRGGMGTVYEAEHLRLGARVALKVLRGATDEHSARRLLREASLTARLNTDYIVRVSDCGTLADGLPYVVMERLHGEDLRSLLEREGHLTVQAALRIALEICAGLADLHAIGVVHRDIKPANVFVLNADLSRCRCKLLDLGIARACNADTTSPVVLGSIRYMAPEQLSQREDAQVQSDVYALGVVLYQCLTGKLPHQGETPEAIAFSILNRRARPIAELRPEISAALAKLIMSAIDRNPSARPRSADDFARSLAAFSVPASLHVSELAPEDTTRAVPSEAPRRSNRRRTLLLVPIAVVAFGVLLLRSEEQP
ncbi:MAG TPA: serine/threonine-protein kinase, partial [Polyangiaceae bacterium]|nr:serine/threonine-protein kinase [Polyangiaceae bacterium]